MLNRLKLSGQARSGVLRTLPETARLHYAMVFSIAALLMTVANEPSAFAQAKTPLQAKSDSLVERRASLPGKSQIIVRAVDVASLQEVGRIIERAGGKLKRSLPIINSHVAEIPHAALNGLAQNPLIDHPSLNRLVAGSMERTGATIGATAVRQELGYDGFGVGVAIIDSGVSAWHDDLTGGGQAQRVDRFVDLVAG